MTDVASRISGSRMSLRPGVVNFEERWRELQETIRSVVQLHRVRMATWNDHYSYLLLPLILLTFLSLLPFSSSSSSSSSSSILFNSPRPPPPPPPPPTPPPPPPPPPPSPASIYLSGDCIGYDPGIDGVKNERQK